MMNDEKELSRKIMAALARHQRPRLFDKKRLFFSSIVSFVIVASLGFYYWESQPRVRITDLDVYHNVRSSSGKSMKIVLDFNTANLKNRRCRAVAYFYYKNGRKVRSTTPGYRTKNRQLSTGDDFRPTYEYSRYENFRLYIPYKYFRRGSYKGEVTTYCGDEFLGNTKNFEFRIKRQ